MGDLFTPLTDHKISSPNSKRSTELILISKFPAKLSSIGRNWSVPRFYFMPAVLATAPAAKQRAEPANGNKANVEQTPKKKVTKNERPSVLCSTPPTCIKDRDSNVEYTRKEFLGEVNNPRKRWRSYGRVDLLVVIWLRIGRIDNSQPKSLQKHH